MVSRGRDHAVLMIDMGGTAGQKDYARKIYGLPYRIKYYRQFDGSRWISEADHQAINKAFAAAMKKNPKFLYQTGVKMEKLGLRVVALADKYRKRNWSKATAGELASIVERMQDAEGRMWGGSWIYGWYFYFNDIYLENLKEILRKKLGNDFDRVWKYTLQPVKLTFVGRERMELCKLARRFAASGSVPESSINSHLKRFAFVNMYYFWGEGFTFRQKEEELKKIIDSGSDNIIKELADFESLALDLKKFPLVSDEVWIIKGFKQMAYAANFNDEATNYYTYHFRPFFGEIAKRLGVAYEELVSMRAEEIIKSIKKGKPVVAPETLKERLKAHALVFAKDKVEVISGKDLEVYRKAELNEEGRTEAWELKGAVAYKNDEPITGNVMIIESGEQAGSFKEGLILVTQMTNPTYLSAIKKAKAIVTDEGGLLCHAAIVSRELKIPCVIGTKTATKTLRNGDLVEVDACKGIVKILKRAS